MTLLVNYFLNAIIGSDGCITCIVGECVLHVYLNPAYVYTGDMTVISKVWSQEYFDFGAYRYYCDNVCYLLKMKSQY